LRNAQACGGGRAARIVPAPGRASFRAVNAPAGPEKSGLIEIKAVR